MKYILILLSLLVSTQYSYSQKAISNETLADQFMTEIKFKSTVESNLKMLVNYYFIEYDNVTKEQWEKVAKVVDVNDYVLKVRQIYVTNFSSQELVKLRTLYKAKKFEEFKLLVGKVDTQINDLANEFGDSTKVKFDALIKK